MSASAASAAVVTAATAADSKFTAPEPSETVLTQAARIAIKEDMPICLDYWIDSFTKKACVGIDAVSGKKQLIKAETNEFTTSIQKVYRGSPKEYIVLTENSIYLTSSTIEQHRIAFRSYE